MKLNKSQRNVLTLGIGLLVICGFFFLMAQRNEGPVFELNLAIAEPVIKIIDADTTQESKLDSTTFEEDSSVFSTDTSAQNGDADLPERKRILLIGDSQLEGLRVPIYNYCVWNKCNLAASVVWYGSTTKQWGTTDTLDHYLNRYKPSFVFIALGLNELFVNDLAKRRDYISAIKNKLLSKGIPYFWIGPAAWKQDKGVIGIMKELNGNLFLDSSQLNLERAEDNRHPSRSAAWVWMEEVSKYITSNGIIDFSLRGERMSKMKDSPFILLKQ